MSLWALVDCGSSNNFVQRQSLDDSKIELIEREILPTRMTGRLATSASVKTMKCVVIIICTLKEAKYLRWLYRIGLGWQVWSNPWFKVAHKVRAAIQLASTNSRYTCRLFTRRPSDERLGASTSSCGCTTSEYDGLTCGWSLVRVNKLAMWLIITLWSKFLATASKRRKRWSSTTQLNRADRGMGVLVMANTQRVNNLLPIIGNTVILDRLVNRT